VKFCILLFVTGLTWFEFCSTSQAYSAPVEYEFEILHIPEVDKAIVKYREKDVGDFLSATVTFGRYSCGDCVRTCDVSINKSIEAREVFRNQIPQKFVLKSPTGFSESGALLRPEIEWNNSVSPRIPRVVWLPPNVVESALETLKKTGLFCGYTERLPWWGPLKELFDKIMK